MEPLLSEGGSPSAANLERIRNTLHAAAGDEELRAEIEAGRVVRDREPVGLGPLAAAAPARKGAGRAAEKQAGARRRQLREARAESERAGKRLRSAEEQLERARVDAEAAQRELRKRERSLRAAREDAEKAEKALRRAESGLEGAG